MKNKKKLEPNKSVTITNNSFIGVQWDKSALEVINTVARSLENITILFKAQNVVIDALLKVDSDK